MNQQIFRRKSIERISSPEQLNDYIRVTDPGVWLLLCAVVCLLVGILVWGVFGRLDSTLSVGAVTRDGRTVCYVKEEDIEKVAPGMTVRMEEETRSIQCVALQPVRIDDGFSGYLLHVGDMAEGQWAYPVVLDRPCGEDGGIYRADITIESIAPMTFVLN